MLKHYAVMCIAILAVGGPVFVSSLLYQYRPLEAFCLIFAFYVCRNSREGLVLNLNALGC